MSTGRKLFIAIDPPGEIKDAIEQLIASDKQAHPESYRDARMTAKENWHITLFFLGEQPEQHIPTIEQAIVDSIEQMPAPTITLNMLTTAPPHRPPRMLWATTTEESNTTLAPIKKHIERLLAHHAIHPQGETVSTFRGHITLARLPEGRRIADHLLSFPHTLSFTPSTIKLMETTSTPSGAQYAIVNSIDFKPSV